MNTFGLYTSIGISKIGLITHKQSFIFLYLIIEKECRYRIKYFEEVSYSIE